MTHMPNYALPLCISLLVLEGLCSCPVAALSPDAPFITIAPVGDHAVGEIITISGTTNYPVNTTLWISLGPKVFTNYPPNYYDDQTLVTPGAGSNFWQVTINTSAFVIDEYSVRVQPVNNTPLFSSITFNMTGRNVGAQDTPAIPIIVIDPLGNHTIDEEFFINGTTNLAVSDGSLLLQIGSGEFNPGGFGSSYYRSNVSIQQGEHGVNIWSAKVEPSQWEVYTKPPNYDPAPMFSPPVPGRYQVVISSKNPYGPDIAATQYLFLMLPKAGNISGPLIVGEPSEPLANGSEFSGMTSCFLRLLLLFSMAPSPDTTPSQRECPSPANTTPWIHLEPVADHSVGDNFSLTGTTNLESGTILSVFVHQSPASANKKKAYTDVRGTAVVRSGACNVNTWSFSDDLTTLLPSPYSIYVTAENATVEANLVQFYIVDDRITVS